MNLTEHAMMEIQYLHLENKEKEDYIRKIVLEFITAFNNEGHSYMSAQIVINRFKKFMKDKTFLDKKFKDVVPNFNESDLVHKLAKKYYELINTEEFVVYEIDEEWIKDVFIRLIDWKPITPLQGTPDEWITHDENGIQYGGSIQNKRYSSVFADDIYGTNACNVNGKVFVQNGLSYTSRDSHIPITFPYEVPLDREVVILESYISVEDAPIYYIKYKYLDQNRTEEIEEITIGYKKSTLDISIDNPKFYKADYCILSKYADDEWHSKNEYTDMPIYRVRMNARLNQTIKDELITRKEVIVGVYEDKECTKKVNF